MIRVMRVMRGVRVMSVMYRMLGPCVRSVRDEGIMLDLGFGQCTASKVQYVPVIHGGIRVRRETEFNPDNRAGTARLLGQMSHYH